MKTLPRPRRAEGRSPEGRSGRSRAAAAVLAALATLVVAGPLSGVLIEERDGVLGAVEWVLRTLVVIAAVVFIAGGVVLALRLRRRVRPRPVGWIAGALAALAFLWFVAIPVGYGVYLTHVPVRDGVEDADLGAAKQAVEIAGDDGVKLHGWYVRSRNRAGVVVMHGTGSNRARVARHARLLVRHGYGVLALDLPGHGESGGRSTSAAWLMEDDVGAAVKWLAGRPDVDPAKLGLLGVSLGGEVALRVAADDRAVKAVVAEGARGGRRDADAAGAGLLELQQIGGLDLVSWVLTGSDTGSDVALVERISPRPMLLLSAGRSTEAKVNEVLDRRGGGAAEHWNLPKAMHAAALRTEPREYERRVVAFLDRTLRPAP